MKITVLNEKNTKVVTLMGYIASAIYSRLHSNFSDVENGIKTTTHDILGNSNLTKSILVSEYKAMQALQKNGDIIPSIIKPKFNSILSTSKTTKQLVELRSLNIEPLDSEILNSMANTFMETIEEFKFKHTPAIRKISKEVKAMINSTAPEDTITDFYNVIPVSVIESAQLLFDRVKDIKVNSDVTKIIDRSYTVTLDTNLSDLELNMMFKDLSEDINKSETEMATFNEINSTMTNEVFDGSNNTINGLDIMDINPLLAYILLMVEKLRAAELNTNEIAWLGICINKLDNLMFKYRVDYIENDRMIIGCKISDPVSIFVLRTRLSEYMTTGGSMNAIYGAVHETLSNIQTKKVYVPIYKTVTDLNTNNDKYTTVANDFMKSKIVEKNNLAVNRVRSMWELVCGNYTDKPEVNKAISEYVRYKSIIDLNNTEKHALHIYSNIILPNRTYSTFVKFHNDAQELNKDGDNVFATSYAIYSLILLYLINQTTLVAK